MGTLRVRPCSAWLKTSLFSDTPFRRTPLTYTLLPHLSSLVLSKSKSNIKSQSNSTQTQAEALLSFFFCFGCYHIF